MFDINIFHLRIAVGVGVNDLFHDVCPLAVCWVFGGGPRSVGDMLKLRTSRFLAAPANRDKIDDEATSEKLVTFSRIFACNR